MTQQKTNKILVPAIGAVIVSGLGTSLVSATENPFFLQDLNGGYKVSTTERTGFYGNGHVAPVSDTEMLIKQAEAKCGADKSVEGKCGESKKIEGKCDAGKQGEGKCGGSKKTEGKCGAEKSTEGKCGEDKQGEGKCGAST